MVTVELVITLGEDFWLAEASRRHPHTPMRLLAGAQEPHRCWGLVEVVTDDLAPVLADLEESPGVHAVEVLETYDGRALVQCEIQAAALYRAVRDAGIVPAYPFHVQAGRLTFEATTTRERLADLTDRLRALGLDFDVVSLTRGVDPDEVLTPRQRELLAAAVRMGYYDTPRRVTLTALAERVGMASSTASGVLHRAEGRIIKRYAAGQAPPDGSE